MYFLFWKIFLKASTLFLISLRIHTKRFSSLWSESHSVVSDSLQPHDYTIHGILQARILEWIAFLFSRGSSQLGIEPRSPTWQANSLQAEPQGKPKNTGVGSLLLLQGIFPIQKSNWGLLHFRQILYQLSYQGSLYSIVPPSLLSALCLLSSCSFILLYIFHLKALHKCFKCLVPFNIEKWGIAETISCVCIGYSDQWWAPTRMFLQGSRNFARRFSQLQYL